MKSLRAIFEYILSYLRGGYFMNLEDLKKFRLFFPGVIAVILGLVVLKNELPKSNPLEDYRLYLICIIVFVVYEVFSVREIFWKPIRERVINANINESILLISKNQYDSHKRYNLFTLFKKLFGKREINQRRDAKIMQVFYEAIDQDDSLKVKSEIVMANGMLLTCLLDTAIISFAAIVVYICKCVFYGFTSNTARILVLICALFILALICVIPCIMKHIRLSDEQLNIINEKYSENIRREIHNDKN